MDDITDDLRSQRRESAEGAGLARGAWDQWTKLVRRTAGPVVDPVARKAGASIAVDLFGFWLTWHLEGGFAGLERMGMGRTTIYRKLKRFRQLTGVHPDEFVLPGVSIDVEKYLRGK